MKALPLLLAAMAAGISTAATIDRAAVVRRFNPTRNASSTSTPLQVGNGNFAFGADVTGLQTFQPFNTLSSWGWHNTSLPETPGQTDPSEFLGLDWWTHGRLVNYDQPDPAQPELSQWLIANPHRINLGRVGLLFADGVNVTEGQLRKKNQALDLYSGGLTSEFELNGTAVRVETWADPESDTLTVEISSTLDLGLLVDFPYANGVKFEAPFVGIWDAVDNHSTTLVEGADWAQIKHTLDSTTYFTTLAWPGQNVTVVGPVPGSHRYLLRPDTNERGTFAITASFSSEERRVNATTQSVKEASTVWWKHYWETGAFVDLTASDDPAAVELQRRLILSQYLLAVNEAGNDPPQESGLTNNGWYGKFHMEMYLWHSLHWGIWNKWSLLGRSSSVYSRFLPTSIERASQQGYTGSRWGKMSDPSGRSAPGEINSLLIWQQPHVLFFAETEWRAFPTNETLDKWDEVLTQTAEFMASFAWWNASTAVYDLGPPMYPVSENTPPNATVNPTFELAYWRFGLSIATEWKRRQPQPVPESWTHVMENLAPLPLVEGSYQLYEGIPNMWTDAATVDDHPALIGIYGLLPPTPGLNLTVLRNTTQMVWRSWNLSDSFGWDFPMLAMNAARLGDRDKAVDFLLDEHFIFDDAGMPESVARVPTPYFPSAGGLLLAVAMMAGGWEGSEGVQFPEEWAVKAEGFGVWM